MQNRVSLFCWVGVVVLVVSVLPAAELPEGFRLEPVLGGLTDPSDLADTPDGRILVAERTTGDLRVMRWGELQLDPICSVSVDATGEGGLLGLAIHPEFADNQWIYLYYTDLTSGVNKVTRFTLGHDSCWGATDILSDLGSGGSGLRNGGGMNFGPDGKLYIATGDMQAQANGQDDQVLQGKVLRVEDDGAIPADNPDPSSAVYAVGVRDGRGLTVNPEGQVYVGDHGEGTSSDHDELHLVAAGGNLGWADETGMGGVHDRPLAAWLPTIGIWGVTDYDQLLFPDKDSDGTDFDHDSYGIDGGPGVIWEDDNNAGECIGSEANGEPCVNNLNCSPIRTGEVLPVCEKIDDVAEHCPGGSPLGDDDCDNLGPAGIDEPDESYRLDIFTAGENEIRRAVLTGAQDALSYSQTFMDSSALPDCPTGWTGLMTGRDGYLYALATNGGGAGGGLYRIVYDDTPGPREVSGPDSYIPLRVSAVGDDEVEVYWEDIRRDSMQPQDDGAIATGLAREYVVWRGTIGVWDSHSPVSNLNGVAGAGVNDVVRKASLQVTPGEDLYFLVSGRSDHLEGTLGTASAGERQGFGVTDICDTLGDYGPGNWTLFDCGQDFTLIDTHGNERSMHEFRGKAIMLDFSAKWCGPCIIEANTLEAIWQEYKDRGVEIVSVIYDEDNPLHDWDGRPTPAECRLWEIRDINNPEVNHTFDCWVDSVSCTGNPCSAATIERQAWPLYSQGPGAPLNVYLNQGLGVVDATAGWVDDSNTRLQLDRLVGAVDTCLH